jgi:hypothetical protein
MANDEQASGFLSRWSRRKAEVREGKVLDEPTTAPTAPAQVVAVAGANSPVARDANASPTSSESPAQVVAPTLADTEQLTPESDFTGFMARGVAPDVKNAAMKKLFTDPHFNVMDRMDVYIDDYSQPDPLPLAILRQMTSAKTLNLFDDAADTADVRADSSVGDTPDVPQAKVVAQSAPIENNSNLESHPNDHADLRLQPDPAPRPEGAGSESV